MAELNDVERAQTEDQFPLLAIDETSAFDLMTWFEAKGWEANTLPRLRKSEYKRLAHSVALHGVIDQILLDPESGWVADGYHRLQIYYQLRAEGITVPFAGFHTRIFAKAEEREALQASVSYAGRVPNRAMKREAASRWIRRHPDWSDNYIASQIGIDQATVTSVSAELEAKGELEPRPAMRLGADGRLHPAPQPRKRLPSPSDPATTLWMA